MRRHVNLESVSCETAKTKMFALHEHVKQSIRDELKEVNHRFGLISDMWSEGTDKYLGLFAMYQVDGKVTRRLVALP